MSKRKLKSAIPNESLTPLGKVVANFAVLESNLDSSIWFLLFWDSTLEQRTGQIVTSILSFKNKINLLSALYQHRFPAEKPFKDLEEIRKKLNKANEKRNDLVHSTWLAHSKKIKPKSSEKKGFKLNFEDMEASEIDKIADLIAGVSYEMQKFYFHIVSKHTSYYTYPSLDFGENKSIL